MGQHGWWQGCEELNISEVTTLEKGTNPNCLYNWNNRDQITGDITKNSYVKIMKGSAPEAIESMTEVEND